MRALLASGSRMGDVAAIPTRARSGSGMKSPILPFIATISPNIEAPGKPFSAGNPRRMQLALRYDF
jgi:hypothetical protein